MYSLLLLIYLDLKFEIEKGENWSEGTQRVEYVDSIIPWQTSSSVAAKTVFEALLADTLA